MNGPERFTTMLSGLTARVNSVEGSCDTHGPASVLVRAGLAWHCPECLDATLKAEYESQWTRDRQAALRTIVDIPLKFRGQRFPATTPAMKVARAMTVKFRDFIVAEPRWAALVMVGGIGTGKTLMACEFAESYINRLSRSVRYITAKGMIGEIQASYGKEGKSEAAEIARFVQYDLLILDEIDAISTKSENSALLLTEIINQRYGNFRPIIAITNQKLETLADFVGDRVADRLRENAFVCAFNWPSFRGASPAPTTEKP